MRIIFLIIIVICSTNCFAQSPDIRQLKMQLDSILMIDQGIREYNDTETSDSRKDTLSELLGYTRTDLEERGWKISQTIDSINLVKVEKIISKYGYPGKTMVGVPANTAVFYVIQHSNKIAKYYPLIEKAGNTGELDFKYSAMMLDRMLTNERKEQIYGTQVYMQMINNPKTGKKEAFEYVLPIKNPNTVNERRKKAGFDSTVEENALRLGVVYKIYTYKEIDQILNQKNIVPSAKN
jgi:hypothetical protein